MEGQKKCKRTGCNKNYMESENNEQSCKFHSGKPIFHDLKKGWECCNKIVYEWPEFEKIVGCCTGAHSDDPAVAEEGFWKSAKVETASRSLEKEAIAKM